jgi:hypothetical protein
MGTFWCKPFGPAKISGSLVSHCRETLLASSYRGFVPTALCTCRTSIQVINTQYQRLASTIAHQHNLSVPWNISQILVLLGIEAPAPAQQRSCLSCGGKDHFSEKQIAPTTVSLGSMLQRRIFEETRKRCSQNKSMLFSPVARSSCHTRFFELPQIDVFRSIGTFEMWLHFINHLPRRFLNYWAAQSNFVLVPPRRLRKQLREGLWQWVPQNNVCVPQSERSVERFKNR